MSLRCGSLLLVLFVAWIATVDQAYAEHEGKVQILLLGDSTTEGSVPRRHVPKGPHLEDVIRELLAEEKDLPPTNVINLGLSGEYIQRLLDSGRYDKLVPKLPGLDYVLIRYGLNDASRREKFDENFPKDYHELIRRLRNDHPQASLIVMTVIPYVDPVGSTRINMLNARVAEEAKLPLFDIYPRYAAELKHGPNMLNYRRFPLEKIPENRRAFVKPFVVGDKNPGVEVMDNRLDAHFGHLPGWYGDRHPNLAGYHVIGDETAKYLAPLIRAKFVNGQKTSSIDATTSVPWPPALPGVVDNTISLSSRDLLEVPATMSPPDRGEAVPFVVAETPPQVDLYFHGELGPDAATRRLWSSWGDLCVAKEGRVYVSIGDHGDDRGGDACCLVHCFDPKTKQFRRVVDMNEVVPPRPGRVAWSKLHAGLHEANDGKIYFTCTLNDSRNAGKPEFVWDESLPGGQVYQYDPTTGKTVAHLSLPAARNASESLFDPRRNRWWCNLEGGDPNEERLWGVDLTTKKISEAPPGSMALRRAFALADDGSVFFNSDGPATRQFQQEQAAQAVALKVAKAKVVAERAAWTQAVAEAKQRGEKSPAAPARVPVPPAATPPDESGRILKWDANSEQIVDVGIRLPGSPGMHVNPTRESSAGHIYGVLWNTAQLFRLSVKDNTLTMLGLPWSNHSDTIHVMELSPDERFLYYLPGGHGGGRFIGTPVVQYEIATGRRKVLAFLGPAFAKACEYTPAGTYGLGLSTDGGTLYVNLNGSPSDRFLPPGKTNGGGFGLTSFAVIEIPESER